MADRHAGRQADKTRRSCRDTYISSVKSFRLAVKPQAQSQTTQSDMLLLKDKANMHRDWHLCLSVD